MQLFKVDDETSNRSQFIFAQTTDRAVELFLLWREANGAPAGGFSITRVTIGSLAPEAAKDLRAALARGLSGMGAQREGSGWWIEPVERDPT